MLRDKDWFPILLELVQDLCGLALQCGNEFGSACSDIKVALDERHRIRLSYLSKGRHQGVGDVSGVAEEVRGGIVGDD